MKHCLNHRLLVFAALILAVLGAGLSGTAQAVLTGPYTNDSHTLHLYHFNEASGPIQDTGSGTALPLSDVCVTYSKPACTNTFGTSLNMIPNGYHSSTVASNIGGHAATSAGVSQTNLQSATGAFTYEALLRVDNITNGQSLISHDGPDGSRGCGLAINAGVLSFSPDGSVSYPSSIPTNGASAYASNQWFHVAVTYNGIENTANNLKLYWTPVRADISQASLLASVTMTSDALANSNRFFVGSYARGAYRIELCGEMDEVRISDVARGSNDFIFAVVPLPAISNGAATNIATTSADLVGTLISTGSSPTTVCACWATNDCTTDTASWLGNGGVTNLGPRFAGETFTNTVSGLQSNTLYYFNLMASNTVGIAWGSSTGSPSFKTSGPPTVNNAGGATLIGSSQATLNGNLTNGTRAHVFCYWWTNGAPITNSYDYGTISEGPFSNTVTGLASSTFYSYRFYATNAYAESWAPIANFTTLRDPISVSGCVLWLKADAGVRTNSSGMVTNWVDQVSGIVVTNSAASPAVPTLVSNWQNGYPALNWSAQATNGLTVPAGSIDVTNGQNRTVFIVARLSGSRGSINEVFGRGTGQMIDLAGTGSSPAGCIRLRNSTNFYANAQLVANGTYIIAVVAQGGSSTNVSAYRNGNMVGSTNYDCALYALTGSVGVGWSTYTTEARSYIGHVAEVVVYNRALDTSDHNAIGAYLSQKYAIASTYAGAIQPVSPPAC
jgi:hypothetical protein